MLDKYQLIKILQDEADNQLKQISSFMPDEANIARQILSSSYAKMALELSK